MFGELKGFGQLKDRKSAVLHRGQCLVRDGEGGVTMRTDQTACTPVPNALLDGAMVELTGAELKVLLFILRWTLGAGQDSVAIGYAQFSDGTGITDRATLSKAL